MDQGPLVEEQIGDGRRLVERFAADGNPVQAAFWVKTAEDGRWLLFVATEIVERDGPNAAYRAMHASRQKLSKFSLSNSEVTIISPSNPIARDVLSIMAHYPGRLATRQSFAILGGMAVDQQYIYSPQVFTFTQANPMTTEDIGRELFRLMNRGTGIVQPSRVTLKDGTAFNGVPFSLELGSQRTLEVRFIAEGEAAPHVVRLDEIASIN